MPRKSVNHTLPLLSNTYFSNLFTLVGGTSLAQLLPVLVLPLLATFYSPKDFGEYGAFVALTSILSVFATGRYELAILLANSAARAMRVYQLSVVLAFLFAMITGVLIFLLEKIYAPELSLVLLYLAPFSVFILAVTQPALTFSNRHAHYKSMALARICRSVGMVAIQIMGFWLHGGALFLALGFVFGNLILTLVLLRGQSPMFEKRICCDGGSFKELISVASEFVRMPGYLLPAHGMNTVSMHAPSIAIAGFFSLELAGFYAIVQRILGAPVGVVASAVGEIYRKQVSSRLLEGYEEAGVIYRWTVFRSFLIGILFFGILLLFFDSFFFHFFSEEWRSAESVFYILLPMYFLRFVSTPVSMTAVLFRKENVDLYWQVLLLLGVVACFCAGLQHEDGEIFLMHYSFIYVSLYLFSLFLGWRISESKC